MEKESSFQTKFRHALENRFPKCIVFKVNAGFRQGSPDLFMIWRDRWAAFEIKRHASAPLRPNQMYYVELLDAMSFCAIVSPENMDEVLSSVWDELTS